MKGSHKQANDAAKKVADSVKSEIENGVGAIADNIAKKGILPRDALGIDDSMLEGIYGQAYRLYNTGKYVEAGQIFRLLVMINSMEPRYSMGLAACFHMMKEYKNAIDTYTLCSIIDPDSPLPQYHISDCYVKLKDPFSAIVALKMAIKRAGKRAEFQTLVDRAKMSIESLKKDLAEQNSKKE